ncbi:MAG: HAD-IA family hydrolase [Lachnospiraceae bacterium]|nr:HAD-IA family hydrolase [Lachnospiraceae bacterium]
MNTAEQFTAYKGKKIALYGLGVETQKALKVLKTDFNIIGLLDGFQEEGSLYDCPIVSLKNVIERGVKLIVVVARPGSCKAIARRIGDKCRENAVALYDIRGNDLLKDIKIVYDFADIQGITKAELQEKANSADIISFDLFDTLIMRQTLFPEDIPEYVDCTLRKMKIQISDFVRRRLGSEKELSKSKAPTLLEIYKHMLSKVRNLGIEAEQLAELEWSIDFNLLVPRKEVCDIFQQLVNAGKKVYIISDTYYNKEQLKQILEKCNITTYTDILASSNFGVSKTRGLYQIFQELVGSGVYLHIGDDFIADIECAKNYGFETCQLLSGIELLEHAGYLGLSVHMALLDSHLRVGMFVSRIFNSPFQFEQKDKRIEISDAYDIGYLFCAPMISDFVFWFDKQIEKQGVHNIWFGARDGYLLKKMYAYLKSKQKQKDESTYFLTSRTAAIRAGIQCEEDICYVDQMKFSGELKENLRERFGIDTENVKNEEIAKNEVGLMQYKKSILEKAASEYRHYQKYIEQLTLKDGDIAFFDFVAKGTSQMYIQRFVSKHLKGIYFLRLEADEMADKGLDIQSFYEEKESEGCAIYENYYILETLLTAPHPSVLEFDMEGKPLYAIETRDQKSIECVCKVQEGILDYFKTYLEQCSISERETNKALDEIFLKMMQRIKITDTNFLKLVIEDPFFHRMTQITDIL